MNTQLTDDQLVEIISGVVDGVPPTTQEIAMAKELHQRRQADKNYFMYGIAEPDGGAYLDEVCVSHDLGILQVIAEELNLNEGTDGYRVVALYTALPLTDDERGELQCYRKAAANPVAWRCDSGSIANQRVVTVSSVVADSWVAKGMEVTPLYIKPQPRPRVPTFDEWLEIRGIKPLGWVRDVMYESYEACRAAMLNGDKS